VCHELLYGREQECAAVDEVLDASRSSRSSALILTGSAGIGKTALLEYARSRAASMWVLETIGLEPEADLPFAALHRLVVPVVSSIGRLPGPQAEALRGALALGPARPSTRFAVGLATLSLLAEAAAEGPLLCLVDDAHWLDQPSADALAFAARHMEAEGIGALFAARSSEQSPLRDSGLPQRTVQDLDSGASARLLDARFSAIAPSVRDAIVVAAGGNPLALNEIAKALTAEQLTGHAALPNPLPLGRDLQRLLADQVRRLSPAAQTVLVVAAADGSGDANAVGAAAAALGADPAAFAEVQAAGLVTIRSGRLDFRHPMLRTAGYEGAYPGQRRAAHAALAQALPGEVNADRRVWHRAALVLTPDDDLADELERTAERARARLGHAAASAALRRSAELTTSRQRRAARLTAAARAAWDAGQPSPASELLRVAQAEHPAAGTQAEIGHLLGLLELIRGVPLEGAQLLIQGAGQVQTARPVKALEMLADAVICASYAGDFATLVHAGRLVSALGIDQAAPEARHVELFASLTAAADTLSPDELPRLRRALDAVGSGTEPRWLLFGGAAAGLAGDHEREELLRGRAEFIARQSAAVGLLAIALASQAVANVYNGDIKLAAARGAEGFALATESGLSNFVCLHAAIRAWAAGVQGDEAQCLALADEAFAHAAPRRFGMATSIANWGAGLLHLGLGRWDTATVFLEAAVAKGAGTGHAGNALRALPDLVEAAVYAGRRELAEAAAAEFADFARQRGPGWALAFAARSAAFLADSPTEKERLLVEAGQLHPASHAFHRARTRLLLGEHLRRERRRKDARIPLRTAFEFFQDAGAAPWAERAARELRASGITVRARSHDGPRALTLQEEQIAEMVGQGASNKDVAAALFLSPHTVEYHLRNVFAKLGISTRAELIRLRAAAH
jgi:DNA-binding CsgD family transcriptional regulator